MDQRRGFGALLRLAFVVDVVVVVPVRDWAAATTSTRPVPLSNDVEYPPTVVYAAPSLKRYVVLFSACSIWAGVAVGLAWNSWAAMPAMCGAAIDVPLIVLNEPTSVSPGPLRGSKPVEQIGMVGRQEEVMFSPGADRSGHVEGSDESPREEYSLTTPSRVPLSWS